MRREPSPPRLALRPRALLGGDADKERRRSSADAVLANRRSRRDTPEVLPRRGFLKAVVDVAALALALASALALALLAVVLALVALALALVRARASLVPDALVFFLAAAAGPERLVFLGSGLSGMR